MYDKINSRLSRIAVAAVVALGLLTVAMPMHSAKAQGMYFGWDFGNGFGVGLGTPPSAFGYHYCGLFATRAPCNYGY